MAVLDSEAADLAIERGFQSHNSILIEQGLESNAPEKATRAIQLAQASGIPAEQVFDDPEFHEVQTKKFLSEHLVNNSAPLTAYINSDPMATHVSSDDWAPMFDWGRLMDRLVNGPLSEEQRKKVASKPLTLIPGGKVFPDVPGDIKSAWDATTSGLYGMATALPKMAGLSDLDEENQKKLSEMEAKMKELGYNPVLRKFLMLEARKQAATSEGLWGLSPLLITKFLRLPSWVAFAGLPVGGVIHHEVSEPVERETGIPASYTDLGMMAVGTAFGFKHLSDLRAEGTRFQKLVNAARLSDPFAQVDKTPPVGMSDVVDHLHRMAAKRDAEATKEVIDAAGKVQTRERVPDLGVKFANAIVGDGMVEIDTNAVRKLYGSKAIEPDDGLLGWIPNLEAQLIQSAKDGGPIRVRADEYFGRIKPEVHKEIADFFRRDPDGMYPEDSKKAEPEAPAPRAGVVPEDGAWSVYMDGERVAQFLGRSAAEEHLQKIAYDQSLEGALKKAAGIDQVDYELSPTDQVEIKPSTMFGRLVLRLPKTIMDRIERLRAKADDARKERQLAKAQKKVMAERAPEWQQRFDEQIAQTWEDMQDNPQYAIKQLFDEGVLGDTTLPEKVRIDRNSIPEGLQKLIPRNWQAKRGGLSLDNIATKLLGLDSGMELSDHIAKLERDRGKISRADYFNRLVSEEARQRMQRKFGDPAQKILDEAMDHVTDDNSYGVIWEHLLAASLAAGKALPHTKETFRDTVIKDMLGRSFSNRVMEDAHREMGKAHKESVDAATKGDWNELLEQQQRYAYNHVLAQEAKKLNARIREMGRFDKQFSKREVSGYAVEHTDRIHDIMVRTGSEVRRGVGPPPSGMIDLDNALRRHNEKRANKGGYSDGLRGFWEEHEERGMPVQDHKYENDYIPNMVVYKELFDPGWVTTPDKMTIGEWQAIADTKKSIAKWGRDVFIKDATGKSMALKDLVDNIIHDIEFFPELPVRYDKLGVAKDAKPIGIRSMYLPFYQLGYVFDRIGRFDPNAPLLKFVYHKLVDAANSARVLETEYGQKLNKLAELSRDINMTEELPRDVFYEPRKMIVDSEGRRMVPPGGTAFRPTTRHNLIVAALNSGLRSGEIRVAKGYGTTPEIMRDYINQHMTKQDWEFVKGVWGLLREIKDLENERDIRMTGATVPEEIGQMIDTPFGRFRGEYYPVIHDRADPLFKTMSDDSNRFRNIRARAWDGFEKPRTAHDGPLSLDFADFNGHLARRLRALGVKEAVAEAGNVFYNERFQRAFANRFGKDLTDMLEPFLQDVAGKPGWESETIQGFGRFFDSIRRGSVQAIAGTSLQILGKHTPTALIHAIGKVGMWRFMEAMHHMIVNNKKTIGMNEDFLYNGATIEGNEWGGVNELKGRNHHWNETTAGGIESILSKPPSLAEARRYGLPTNMSVWKVLKNELIQAGSWAIRTADMKIAEATYIAEYTRAMEELGPTNMTRWEAHLEANRLGEAAIRDALGSTAITSRPAIMRQTAWYYRSMTAFMGFFNSTMMRLISTKWRTQDAFREYMQTADGKELMGQLRISNRTLMTFFVLTAFVEQAVSAAFHKDQDPAWYKYGVKPFLHLGSQMFPVARQVFSAVEYGAGFNPGMTIVDSGVDKFEKLAQVLTDPRKWRTPRGEIQLIGAALDALAVYPAVGTFQSSKVIQGLLNVMWAGEMPTEVKHFWNLWTRGTIREPRHRRH